MKKYTNQGVSSLHDQILPVFDKLYNKCHHAWVENLYNYSKFCNYACNHPKYAMVSFLTSMGLCGLHDFIIQYNSMAPIAASQYQGHVKAEVLKNDPECKGLIDVSIYDS